jgi:lipopolysaccharide transport system ATP-binding protein
MMGHLRVSGLGKGYKRYPNRWARAGEWLTWSRMCRHELIWVLRDVSFDIRAGQAVGIVGQNGAGKTTLLKLITGTTAPTTGSVTVGGRVAALLELGMGFHPYFTGRQNVFMAGQLLGFSNEEIAAKLPDIERFAEIGSYIDEPVRTYSSGMQVRLAFSIATAIRPDILIVDESLAVGDAYFVHKCIARIREFKSRGTTLLFVSHDPGAVKSLCDRAILLEHGVVVRDGSPDAVLDYYNATIAKREADYAIKEIEHEYGKSRTTRSGNGRARILDVETLESGASARAIRSGGAVTIRVHMMIEAPIDDLTVGFLIRDRLGNDIFGTNTHYLNVPPPELEPGRRYQADFGIPCLALGTGNYSISVALHSHGNHLSNNYDWWDQAAVFQVVPGNGPVSIGVCALPLTCVYSPARAEELI